MELINSIEDASSSYSSQTHPLIDKWVLWAHLPHNTDWSLKSYIKLQNLETVEDVVSITNAIPEKMVKNCMLFLMRKNINPVWEDPLNCNGGCFSFKVLNKNVLKVWKELSYTITGETLSTKKEFMENINGITISPKKSFCIIKLWTKSLDFQNPRDIIPISGLQVNGCLFKKHKSSY